jgi:cytoskeletal protein RodZ
MMKRNAKNLYLALLMASTLVVFVVSQADLIAQSPQSGSSDKPQSTAANSSSPTSAKPPSTATASPSTSSASTTPASGTPAKPKTPSPNAAGVVWINTDTGVYHKQGTRWYGKTKHGKYMLEADAVKAGYKAAK